MKKIAAAAAAPRISGPSAHAALWLVCVAAVLGSHFPYLRLPFFWDEAGYYFPAALDLAHGHLLPVSTVVNPHPPLLAMYLALVIKLFGAAPIVIRSAMCVVAGTALYAMLLVAAMLIPAEAGLWATGFLALSPLFFAQASLAQLDVAATAGTLLTVYFYLRGRITGFLIAATLLCLTRETGAAVVVLLAILARNPIMLLPLLPLGGWFVYLRIATGHFLGDPGFVAYNIWTTLNPLRFLATLVRRTFFLFFTDFRWALAIPALTALWRARKSPPGRPGYQLLWLVLAVQVLVMTFFGGAIQDRYLLPALALFYLLSMEALERLKIRNRKFGLMFLLLVQIACFFWNPPYPFPYEDNLAYADFVNLHETAADRIHSFAPGTRVLTAWPATAEFTRPELGYVDAGITVVPLTDFSEESFANVRREDFDAVFMFSNEWRPQMDLLNEWPVLAQIRDKLYDHRPQVTPEWVRIKYRLGSSGSIHLHGQWVEWLQRYNFPRRLER